MGASTGLVSGVSAGSAQMTATFPSLVVFTGEMCSPESDPLPCPVESPAPVSSGTAISGSITVNLGPPPSSRSSSFSSGDNLSFANQVACGATTLGAQGCASGWFWQVEVAGTVSDNAANWAVSQNFNSGSTTWTYTDLTQKTMTWNPTTDNPSSSLTQLTNGSTKVFFLDSPGPLFYSNILSVNDQATFTSRMCSSVVTTYCVCVDWGYTLVGNANLSGTAGTVNTSSSSAAITQMSYSCQPQQ